ncbi:Transcriptional regulator, GntR family [Nostocoides japonicum T1-X7]|uniref:Transcriptional regulator, GntR family n=1 Tax=Nostocoides japonicum T1-X7 TaxID=1194083 RepID=A0A077LT34_9MICO|nr:GntR family transcriptional regulator [Tetrasphaera japonica]CCH76106.1 Transcriptional regulator, GntR family [Tetrasphaera japonica T1-X7]
MSGVAGIELVGRSTAEQVAEGLENLIVEGTLRPGERISEAGIARTLGLSRNTVREALRLLQGSGLVRYSFNRGLVVWDPTDEDIVEVFKARLYLERLAATCLHASTDLTGLELAHADFEHALASGDPRTIVDEDLALHQAIVATLGSTRLDRFYAGLVLELRYFLMLLSLDRREYEDPAAVRAEHRALVEAFLTRDPGTAAAAATALVEENQELVREVIARRGDLGSTS